MKSTISKEEQAWYDRYGSYPYPTDGYFLAFAAGVQSQNCTLTKNPKGTMPYNDSVDEK
jgi:hypothetical protein